MKTYWTATKSRALVAVTLALTSIAAVWPSSVKAIGNPEIRPVEFSLLSLAPGQTARLSVLVNPVPEPPSVTPARRVRLGFDAYAIGDVENRPNPSPGTIASSLNKLVLLGRQSRVVALLPGEAARFDFTSAMAETVHFNAIVIDLDAVAQDATALPVQIVATLEVLERGRVVLTLPGVSKGFAYGGGG